MAEDHARRPPPPGWGDDELTQFLDIARINRFATFVQRPQAFARLLGIDQCFVTVAKDWLNPRSKMPALLLLRAHAHFRAACEHAMATQLAETFVLIRALLETAAYALHIDRNPGLDEVWLRRHDDADSKKAAKAEFTIANVRNTLGAVDRGATKAFEGLYELSIDFGGHPNERAVTVSTAYEKVPGGTAYKHFYFTDDAARIDFIIRSLAQAGVCALVILQNVFSARFELLGVRHRILNLRQGL